MPKKFKHRRKLTNYLIIPKFQLRFLVFLTIGSALPIVATWGIITYFIDQYYINSLTYAPPDIEIAELILKEQYSLRLAVGLTFFGHILGIFVLGVIFSHRIAGVVFKLSKTFKEVASGADVKLKFRKHDEFKELADDFNLMIDALKGKAKKHA